ncbi:type IV secretion system protein [Caballeronia sp. LP003]|uniref:type IV secretion system protein n=1 Tax=Caballeronia sp. LP003 TaxID=3038551 RepID=UPI00285BA1CA|nr:type IV secretion system protein [Caballeronia sp. LP003]MDR5791721.1 type IV secretion system protein [Caballeronia sp. LP003]
MSPQQQAKYGGVQSPWTIARMQWDDRQMRLSAHAANWRRAFFYQLPVTGLAILGLIYCATLPKKFPVPIAVDKLGRSVVVSDATSDQATTRASQEYREVNDFIENLRTIIADNNAQKKSLGRAYARMPNDSAARSYVIAHMTGENDPFAISKNYSVDVTVINALKLSEGNWEVEWSETAIGFDGKSRSAPIRYKAHLTIQMIVENDERVLRTNPAGFYVTNISWTKEL